MLSVYTGFLIAFIFRFMLSIYTDFLIALEVLVFSPTFKALLITCYITKASEGISFFDAS